MADTVKALCSFSLETDPSIGFQGSTGVDTALEIAINGERHDIKAIIANDSGAAHTLWDTGDTDVGDFDFLFIKSDQPLYIKLVTATAGHIFKLRANMPFVLGGDDIGSVVTVATITADPSAGDEVVTQIYAYNVSGTDANVQVSLFT